MKAPLPQDEAARLDALYQYKVLDTDPEKAFDDLVLLAASVCGTPIALVSLTDECRQWFKSKLGIDAVQTPRDVAFCAYAILQPDVLVVPDTLNDERFATNPLVTNAPHIRFYAATPLIAPSGHALGTLCVIDYVPRSLTPEQVEALRALGRQVVTQLELRRYVEALQQSEQRLRQMNEQLEEVSRLKSEFLTNMSHELRTPLTSILGFSSVLLQQIFGSLTTKQQEYLSCIYSSGDHLLSLINDLLDLAKIEAGKMELNRQAVDVAGLCQAALQMMAVRAEAKHQHLSLELPVATESVLLDRQRVTQMLLNYLSNAVKFTPEGGAIALSTRLAASQELEALGLLGTINNHYSIPSASYLVLSVTDNGIGIAPDKQHLLFQTFQQVDGAMNRQYDGTGLGLALTRRLAELHRGTVSFTSTLGVGSTFSIWLPLL